MAFSAGVTTTCGVSDVEPCGMPLLVYRPVAGELSVILATLENLAGAALVLLRRHQTEDDTVPESNTVPESKGHLNPGSGGVSFDRFELGSDLADLVRHVWVPQWAVPDGEVRPQRVLSYPAIKRRANPLGSRPIRVSQPGVDAKSAAEQRPGDTLSVGSGD